MVKDSFMALVTLTVAGWMLLPAFPAQAFGNTTYSAEEVIANMAKAESVAFTVDLDVATKHATHLEQAREIHIDIDGATDFHEQTEITANFSSSNARGAIRETGGFLTMIENTLYLSEDGEEWYFLEFEGPDAFLTENDISDDMTDAQNGLRELLDRGVITYSAKGIAFASGAPTVRYTYTIHNDRLAQYLYDTNFLSETEAEQMRHAMTENVRMGGEVWIDVSTMLPVMFTLDVSARFEHASDSTMRLSVRFKNFNEPLNLTAPSNAQNIANADWSRSTDAVEDSFTVTMGNIDADGDGLTNADEKTVWFSNPFSNDSDGDGYLDYTEVINGYDPNGVGVLDSDGDGLTDYAEMTIHWSDRFDADSDNDGYPDGIEIANGYNPNGPGRW